MKKILLATLAAMAAVLGAEAQTIELRQVSLDSLISTLRREVNPRTYYVKDAAEQAMYTVSAPKSGFLQAAKNELSDKGYSVTEYDGALFVLHGKSLYQNLPTGFFAKESASTTDNSNLQQFLSEQSTIAAFQNKTYEIGERGKARSGKVYVSGHVRDVASGEPIVGASIYDEASGAYSVTDASGFYRILLPTGDRTLSCSGYSLEDMHLSLRIFDDGVLDVVMKEKVTALKEAVVSADAVSRHKNASMGLEKVRMNVVTKVPSAFGEADVLKVVLTLPGVKSVGEASSGFNVRGGSTDQNLILFNENTIYNPSHMFGIFSAFNTDVIGEMELYKASIPAEYGGRISSVLDVRGREGNSKEYKGSLGIGLLTSRIHLEGPIVKDRTTFILGGRTTYSNWIFNLLPEGSNYSGGKSSFSDLNLGITHKVNSKNTIHAYGYWSRDSFSFSNDTTFRYSNINASLKWRSNFNEKNSMVASVGYDKYGAQLENDFNEMSGYSISTGIQQVFAKLNFKSLISDRHSLSYGLNAIYYDLNPGKLLGLHQNTLVKPRDLSLQKGVEPALYISDEWKLNDKLMFDGGIRLSSFLAMSPSKFYINPEFRISGKYSFNDDLSIKAGFNSMTQFIHLITNSSSISPIDTWQLSNDKIRPQTGWQAASGLYWTVADGQVDLSLEGYYKRMEHYLDYKSGAILMMNENLVDDLVETQGKAYGVELMVKKSTGKLTGWASATWSRTLLRDNSQDPVAAINQGKWYNAAHDKPIDFKLVGNYKFTHRYSVSMNIDYATGRPVTIPTGWYYYGGGMRLAYSDRNAYRIPDYFRMDVALNIDPGHYLKQLSHMSMTIGVYNVTGRKNAYSVYFDTDNGSNIKGHMLSVFACPIPYINLNLNF